MSDIIPMILLILLIDTLVIRLTRVVCMSLLAIKKRVYAIKSIHRGYLHMYSRAYLGGDLGQYDEKSY